MLLLFCQLMRDGRGGLDDNRYSVELVGNQVHIIGYNGLGELKGMIPHAGGILSYSKLEKRLARMKKQIEELESVSC